MAVAAVTLVTLIMLAAAALVALITPAMQNCHYSSHEYPSLTLRSLHLSTNQLL